MTRHKMVDGVRIEFTPEEEAERDAEEAAWEAGSFDRAMTRMREDRTRRLSATDYYALSDVAMSQDMTNYRQELRDLPDGLTTEDEVKAVVWPVTPGS